MQSILRNKLTELQKKRSSPRKRAAEDDDGKNVSKDNYYPPHKRREGFQISEVKQPKNHTTSAISTPISKEIKLENLNETAKENIENKMGTSLSPTGSPKKLSFSFLDFDFSAGFENKSWVDIIDEEQQQLNAFSENCNEENKSNEKVEIVSSNQEEQSNYETDSANQIKRTASAMSNSSNSKLLPKPKESWAEPEKGWCWDEETLTRRDKELQKMKEKPTYKRYLKEVPKIARQKGIHPKTPNKFLAWSRRSWDKQVKVWKRSIYEWAGESPSSSVASSYCPSECSDDDDKAGAASPTPKRIRLDDNSSEDIKSVRKILFSNINVPANPDAMASLLGNFDLETLREAPTLLSALDDESTLKNVPKIETGQVTNPKSYAAVAAKKVVKGPIDFSHMT